MITLKVSDFTDTPNYSQNSRVALTSVFVGYDYNPNGPVYYTPKCYFIKNQSWFKKELFSTSILKHEQVHFDIGEVYTRKLLAALEKGDTTISVRSAIYRKIYTELNQTNALYDIETNHSIDTLKQKEWNERIADSLNKYKSN